MGSLPLAALEAIETTQAPAPVGPYNQAVRAGNLLFCSGQIALDPASGSLVGEGDVARETRQVLANLVAVLDAAGGPAQPGGAHHGVSGGSGRFRHGQRPLRRGFWGGGIAGKGLCPGGGLTQGRPRRDRRHRRSRLNPGPMKQADQPRQSRSAER